MIARVWYLLSRIGVSLYLINVIDVGFCGCKSHAIDLRSLYKIDHNFVCSHLSFSRHK